MIFLAEDEQTTRKQTAIANIRAINQSRRHHHTHRERTHLVKVPFEVVRLQPLRVVDVGAHLLPLAVRGPDVDNGGQLAAAHELLSVRERHEERVCDLLASTRLGFHVDRLRESVRERAGVKAS